MSTTALLASAALMGLAGSPHCAGMCGAGCAAVASRCTPARLPRGWAGLLTGRLIGYALAGAAVASAAGALRWLGDTVAWLRPIWASLQVAAFVLGLWLLVRGRLPLSVQAWAERLGRPSPSTAAPVQRIRLPGELQAAAVGLLWPVIPCGLLHAALLVAAVASGPLDGAVVMLGFALASSIGLAVGPAFWLQLVPAALRSGGDTADTAGTGAADRSTTFALRVAGALVVLSMGWSLRHSVIEPLQAWCA
jgi:sulfite exporter TauE/SafE